MFPEQVLAHMHGCVLLHPCQDVTKHSVRQRLAFLATCYPQVRWLRVEFAPALLHLGVTCIWVYVSGHWWHRTFLSGPLASVPLSSAVLEALFSHSDKEY